MVLIAALSIAHCENYFPQHDEVRAHNLALARGQIKPPSALPEGINATAPTFEHPFAYSYVRVLSAMPSVDSYVSEFHRPSVLWVWGASFNYQYTREYIPQKNWDGCYRTFSTLSSTGKPYFNGTMDFEISGKKFSQPSGGPEVQVPASLWKNLSVQKGPNGTAVLPVLAFSLNGSVYAPFSLSRTDCRKTISTQPGGVSEGCLCQSYYPQDVLLDSGPLFHQKNWSIEVGEPFAVILSPQGGEQLSYKTKFEALVFSSHRLAQVSLLANDHIANASALSTFGIANGSFGQWQVVSEPSEKYGANLTPGSLPLYGNSSTLQVSSGESFAMPASLDAQRRSFAYQYFLSSNISLGNGQNSIQISTRNKYDDNYSQGWGFLVRDGSFFSSSLMPSDNASELKIINSNGEVEIPERALAQISSEPGGFSNRSFGGNDVVRPAAIPIPPQPKMQPFNFAAPIAIFVALGALWLFRYGKN